jgi:hypothetical protein
VDEVESSDFEVNASTKRTEGFDLSSVESKRDDEDTKRGFDAFTQAA